MTGDDMINALMALTPEERKLPFLMEGAERRWSVAKDLTLGYQRWEGKEKPAQPNAILISRDK